MRIFIDTNIVLDVLLKRSPFNEAAERILIICADAHIGFLSVNSLTDIFYVARKSLDALSTKAVVRRLIELLEIIPINKEDCINALSLPIDDFEDGLIFICAEKAGADFIVTRDEELLKIESDISVIAPDKLLGII